MPLDPAAGAPLGVIDRGRRDVLTGRDAELVRRVLHAIRYRMAAAPEWYKRGKLVLSYSDSNVQLELSESFDRAYFVARDAETPIAAPAQG